MIYKWKFQPKGKVSAQIAGKCIEKITKKHKGRVTPKMILDEARMKRHPLHACFEWDDGIAAEKYREQQAQRILVQLVIVEGKEQDETPIKVRAFVSVEENDNTHYTTFKRAMTDPQLRGQILTRALAELNALNGFLDDLPVRVVGDRASRAEGKKNKTPKGGIK